MKTLPYLLLLLLTLTASCAQTLGPVEVAQQIFGKTKFARIQEYSTGEYQGHPNGQDLPPTATTHFLLLGQDDKRAVVDMTVTEGGKAIDTYLHFQKDVVWKLCAFRALAMTGIIEQAKQELEQMTPVQVDALIARAANSKNAKDELIRSRADYDFELGNLGLVLQSDDQLVEHFRRNKLEFDRMRDQALLEAAHTNLPETGEAPVGNAERAAYRKLFISSLHLEAATGGTRLNFLIGGMVDNSVGYYYIPNRRAVPSMTPDDIIMLRELGGGWYLYKTT